MNTITIETTTKGATLSSTSLEVFNDIIPFSVAFTTSGTSSTEQVVQLGYSGLSVGIRVGSSSGELVASSELWEIVSGTARLSVVLGSRAQELIAYGSASSIYVEVTLRTASSGTSRYGVTATISASDPTLAAAAAVAGAKAVEKVSNCIASAIGCNPYALTAATGVTVTVGSTHNATLSSRTNPGIGDAFWREINGWARVQDPAGLKFSNNLQSTHDGFGNYQVIGGVEFCTDAPLVEVQVGQPYNSKIRVLVSDESGVKFASAVLTLTNSVDNFIAIDFSSGAKRRKITIISEGVSGNYWSFSVAPPYSLMMPSEGRRLCIIGDSNTCGVGATTKPDGWSEQVALMLGMRPDNVSHAATGYLYDYNNEGNTYRGRLAVDVFPKAYDAIIIQSSTNDTGATPAVVAAEALTLWQELREHYPHAPIIITGILGVSGADQTSWENALAAQFTAWGDGNSLWIPLHSKFSGTGSVAAPSGTGNNDIYRYDGGPHLSQAGHDYTASIVTEAIRAWLT